jgi:uncharacterized membrane protein
MLVISFDEIPANAAEMLAAIKRIPGFAASFATLMMFWLQHRRWSRRYGLENIKTLLFSLILIFVMLVYVYPLRMIFEGMFSQLTGGYLPTAFELNAYSDLRLMFIFYSSGFLALSLLIAQLYRAAADSSVQLALSDSEFRRTRIDMRVWEVATGFGVVSILLAIFLPDPWVAGAGYVYVAFFFAGRIPVYLDKRKHALA